MVIVAGSPRCAERSADGDCICFFRFPCRCAAVALCPLGWVVAPWLEASLGSSMSVFLLSSDHCGLMLYESLSCAAPMDE
mmetsp:Transcript_162124/g.515026  ORF Transcript_162124/g.515026 Transcript_162124/m.515026 type:complete len:80 (+) Transcript_162124:132-371(+)